MLGPPTFSCSSEPNVADDWLHTVNKCLVTVGCNEEEKVRFATHLLEGAATIWWDDYQTIYPIEGVTWDMFQKAFRMTYVLPGVMSLDKK